MKKSLYLIIFLLAVATASAQNPAGRQGQARIDSLLKELPKRKNDIRKVNLLNSLSYNYQYVYAKKGIDYGKQALQLAQKLKWDKGIAIAQYNIAGNYNIQYKPDTALVYANTAFTTGQKLKDNFIIANSLMNIGLSYYYLAENTKALEYYRQAQLYAEKTNDKALNAWIQINTGSLYIYLSEYDKAIQDLKGAQQTAKEMNNQALLVQAEGAIGRYYADLGKYSPAEKYYKNALAVSKRYGFKESVAIMYNNLGTVNRHLTDFPVAMDFLQQAIKAGEGIGNKYQIAFAEFHTADVYSSLMDYDRAMEHYRKALEVFKQSGDKFFIAACINDIGDCYEQMGDYEQALKWYKESLNKTIEIKDKFSIPLGFYNVGHIYYYLSDYSQSLYYAQQALKTSRESNSFVYAPNIFSLHAELYLHTPDSLLTKMDIEPSARYRHAIDCADSALYYVNEAGTLEDMVPVWKLRSEIHREQGDFEQALNAYQTYVSLRDSITSEETQKQVTRKQMQFEFEKKEAITKAEREKKDIRQRNVRNASFATVGGLLLFSLVVLRQRNKVKKEKKRSDTLLLNILPEEVADELKAKGSAEAKQFDEVSILFTDFVNFTQTAEKLTPQQLVRELNECFTAFDNIIERNGLEKIKTIGDAYMAVCGLPNAHPRHAQKTVQAALEIRDFIEERRKSERVFEIRIGIHSGSVVAGIVGVKKFAYDIWGDTVNTAARMESSGEPGKVNISDTTYELVKEDFNCSYRGKIEAKGKGEVDMYFVNYT